MMERIIGTIYNSEGSVISENVPIWIGVGGTEYKKTWRGYFETTSLESSQSQSNENDQNYYSLQLEDGRKGQFLVTRISGDYIYFTGSGPLG